MNKRFEQLPQEVQEHIKMTLKAYDEIFVTYENGRYQYGMCLKANYAADHEVIGTFYKEEVYTPQELIENYIEEFHSFPRAYKGKQDWGMLRKLQSMRRNGIHGIVELVDGNAEIVGERKIVW